MKSSSSSLCKAPHILTQIIPKLWPLDQFIVHSSGGNLIFSPALLPKYKSIITKERYFQCIIISIVAHKVFTISNTKQNFLPKTSTQPLHPSILIQDPSYVHMLFGSKIYRHLDKYLQIKTDNGSQKISPYKIFVR